MDDKIHLMLCVLFPLCVINHHTTSRSMLGYLVVSPQPTEPTPSNRVPQKFQWKRLIKYVLNRHMWCAIIVNKQTSLRAPRKSKNIAKKLLKNFHWNFNISLFETFRQMFFMYFSFTKIAFFFFFVFPPAERIHVYFYHHAIAAEDRIACEGNSNLFTF